MFSHRWMMLASLAAFAALSQAANNPTFASRTQRYQLQVSDVLGVQFRLSPEYNANVTVQPDGFVSLPMLGDVKLSGLTIAEATDAIKQKASDQLNDPEISVQLNSFELPHYIVGGEVANPGKFDFRGPVTVLRAVQLAGGLKASAKNSKVLLIRPINDTDAEVKVINLKRTLKEYTVAEDIQLKAGDLVVVPMSNIAKFENLTKLVNWGMYFNPINP